ncbi:MAG: hypothetical protein HY918_01425 [Candidatus Doudnabacteria bacterium]|nr:hypothetical protein [Candidatus Doudnabacteria bacterium]
MFGKNKKKLDPRVRFQNRGFQKQLDSQRNYKRTKKTLPQTDWGVFLSKIGLGSWPARLGSLALFLFIIYIVFIPNLFFIKNVTINGLDESKTADVKTVAESFLKKSLPWPQKNILLLSKNKLTKYLLENNQSVLKVDKITKDFPNTLVINITPRLDTFTIIAQSGVYAAANDGLIKKQLAPEYTASTTLPNGLILIKLTTSETLFAGKHAFPAETANFLLTINNQVPNIVKSPLEHFELADQPNTDLTVFTQSGLKLLFDLKSDPQVVAERLQLLLSQFSDADLKSLDYVDMRFDSRGYICKKGAACVKNTILPVNNATDTTDSIIN